MDTESKDARATMLESGRVPFRATVAPDGIAFAFEGFKLSFPTGSQYGSASVNVEQDMDELNLDIRGCRYIAADKDARFSLVKCLESLIARGIECGPGGWLPLATLVQNEYAVTNPKVGKEEVAPYVFRAPDDKAAIGVIASYLAGAGRTKDLQDWAVAGMPVVRTVDGLKLAPTDLAALRAAIK